MKYDVNNVLLKPISTGVFNEGTFYAVYYDYGEGHEYVCNMRFFPSWEYPNRMKAVGNAKNYCRHNKDYGLIRYLKKRYVWK